MIFFVLIFSLSYDELNVVVLFFDSTKSFFSLLKTCKEIYVYYTFHSDRINNLVFSSSTDLSRLKSKKNYVHKMKACGVFNFNLLVFFPNLKTLYCDNNEIFPFSKKHLKKVIGIEGLHLVNGFSIKGEDLIHCANKLKELSLCNSSKIIRSKDDCITDTNLLYLKHLRSLVVKRFDKIKDNDLLLKLNLNYLEVHDCEGLSLKFVLNFKGLKTLKYMFPLYENYQINDQILINLNQIEHLELCNIDYKLVSSKDKYCAHFNLEEKDIIKLNYKLRKLVIWGCENITDRLFSIFKSISYLEVRSCREISDGIKFMVNLNTLILERCNISDDGLSKLCSLKHLEFYNCGNVRNDGLKGKHYLKEFVCIECPGISDKGILNLCSLKHLTLKNNKRKFSNRCVRHLPKLRILHLEGNGIEITDKTIQLIMVKLKELVVVGCKIKKLCGVKGLVRLSLYDSEVVFEKSLDFVSLEYLELRSCPNISDHSLNGICGLLQLILFKCPQITNIGVNGLKKLLKLVIYENNEITDNIFQNLEKIEYLSIESCNSIGVKYFECLDNLKHLYTRDCARLDEDLIDVLKSNYYVNIMGDLQEVFQNLKLKNKEWIKKRKRFCTENVDKSKVHKLDKIAQGSYGEVFRGKYDIGIGFIDIAIKSLFRLNDGMKEFEFLRKLKHQNVLQFYGAYEEEGSFHLLLELCKTCIAGINLPGLSFLQKVDYFIQICKGMIFIHSKNIIHKDLKLENILLSFSNEIKISDFGIARDINDVKTMSFSGTLEYIHPKLLVNETIINEKEVDIYSFGIVMLKFFLGSKFSIQRNKIAQYIEEIVPKEFKLIVNDCIFNFENILSFDDLLGRFIRMKLFCNEENVNLKCISSIKSKIISIGLNIDKTKLFFEDKELGKGSYGVVFKGELEVFGKSRMPVAIKKIIIKSDNDFEIIKNEIIAMKILQSNENILKCYGCFFEKNSIFIVTELCNNDLSKIDRKKISFLDKIYFLKQTASGIKFMHENGYVHRDLKLENLFINNKIVKIGDFGLTKIEEFCRTITIGSYLSIPPEIALNIGNESVFCYVHSNREKSRLISYYNKNLKGKKLIPQAIDSYAFGLLAWRLLTSFEIETTFNKTFLNGFDSYVRNHLNNIRPNLDHIENKNVRKLISRCLEMDFNNRLKDFGIIYEELSKVLKITNTKAFLENFDENTDIIEEEESETEDYDEDSEIDFDTIVSENNRSMESVESTCKSINYETFIVKNHSEKNDDDMVKKDTDLANYYRELFTKEKEKNFTLEKKVETLCTKIKSLEKKIIGINTL